MESGCPWLVIPKRRYSSNSRPMAHHINASVDAGSGMVYSYGECVGDFHIRFKQVSVGRSAVWAVSTDGKLYVSARNDMGTSGLDRYVNSTPAYTVSIASARAHACT